MTVYTTKRPDIQTNSVGIMEIPNLLTCFRIVAVPAIVFCATAVEPPLSNWMAFSIFVLVAISDFLDGYLARIWSQQSKLGRMLDPVADKLLVAVCLLLLVDQDSIGGWSIWAATAILAREILVSGLRQYLVEAHVVVPVTLLSKWKTALQFIAVGLLLLGDTGQTIDERITVIGLICLWSAALITLYTGYTHLRDGFRSLLTKM